MTFVGYDEGNQALGLYGTDGAVGWRLSLAAWPLARDLQRVAGGVLVGFDRGYFELDPRTGNLGKVVDRWSGVTSVRRLDTGETLVAGLGLEGHPGIVVLTLDPQDRVVTAASRPGDYVRLLRPAGPHWLLGADDRLLETDSTLALVGTLAAPGFRHAWMAERRAGRTLVSAGYGAFLAEFDTERRLVRTFGGAGDVPPFVSPFFYAGFEWYDGRLFVANWQGHGPDNATKGRQLVAFGPDGAYQDSWSHPEISSLQAFLLMGSA